METKKFARYSKPLVDVYVACTTIVTSDGGKCVRMGRKNRRIRRVVATKNGLRNVLHNPKRKKFKRHNWPADRAQYGAPKAADRWGCGW